MGQKVHPIGFRLGTIKNWKSQWFAEKDYATLLHEDLTMRNYVTKKLSHAAVSSVEIERVANKASKVKVNIYTARPGIIIGKKGSEVETLKNELQALTKKEIIINIKEIRKAETEAQLVAENVAFQLKRRVAFRRAMKRSVTSAHQTRGARYQDCLLRPFGGTRDGAPGMVSRRPGTPAHHSRRYRLRLRRGANDIRHHRHQGVDF